MVTKNSSAVFLFPGQGAQYPGMGIDLLESGVTAVAELFAIASDAAGQDMVQLLRSADADTLKRTDVSQVAITLANLAAAAVLADRGVAAAACAGFSLGEYAALAESSVVSRKDCFKLVSARGKAMQASVDRIAAASAEGAPGMAAVLGLAPEQVEALIAEWRAAGLEGLYGANFNSPRQVVVAGTSSALAEAETRFKAAGAKRVLRLQVAGPFHSPLVADAAESFAAVLESVPFSDPALTLFSNVTGAAVVSGAEAKKLALRQITESVRWTAEEGAIAALGAQAVLEVGPGKVLQGLWKDSGSTVPCHSAGTLSDIDLAVAALAQTVQGAQA